MARRRSKSPSSGSKSPHSPAEPPPLALRPKQREPPRFKGDVQRAKIILGFSAIGKTHLAATANREFGWLHVIDFSVIPQGLDLSQDYKAEYLQTIADAAGQPGVLLLGGPRWVGEFLVANDLAFSSVYPTDDCKEEYISRWDQMGEEEGLIFHRLTWWDDLIAAMQWPNGRCNHFELYPGVYLEDIFMNILTAADQVEGLDDESEEEEEPDDMWHDAPEAHEQHEPPQSPTSATGPLRLPSTRRKTSPRPTDTTQQAMCSIKSSWSSQIRTFLNYIFLILQFIFLWTLATLIMLAYEEWNIWQTRNRPNLPTISEFPALTEMHNTSNDWFLPDWLPPFLPNCRETWLGIASFRKELVALVQKWLDLEESLLKT
ncbi:hypothetical protein DSL72_008062 [Monilinia vaccinii-corymbosi]|uniref:Uncharacterized protein n=1 Tax=Monilinia vaccinii-corymbosi TaxID=61207 RepID=A0A8A3PJL1_9HELO|nr:hypothetical protein DSL72_008062 [Monilinia vaccinii-corymbosi]